MKHIFVASGGADNGGFHVGVLSALVAQGMWFDAMRGTSTGAIVTGHAAQAGTPEELNQLMLESERIWRGLNGMKDIFRQPSSIIGKAIQLLTKGGLLDPSPLVRLVNLHIDDERVRTSPIDWSCGITDLISGLNVNVSYPARRAIVASSIQPVFMVPVEQEWVDGGLVQQTPVKSALLWAREQEDQVHMTVSVANTLQLSSWKFSRDPLKIGMRTLQIILHYALLHDLLGILDQNTKLIDGEQTDGDKKYIGVRMIYPTHDLGNSMNFDPKEIAYAIDQGKNETYYKPYNTTLSTIQLGLEN